MIVWPSKTKFFDARHVSDMLVQRRVVETQYRQIALLKAVLAGNRFLQNARSKYRAATTAEKVW